MDQRNKDLRLGQQFVMDGGDGDQSFFSERKMMRLTTAAWFPGHVRRGPAMLLVVEGGKHDGEYVALTTRVLASLDDQLTERNWASVVVHRIKNPTPSFDGSEKDAYPIGMSFVEKI
jgi:hypothetical protein